MHKIIYNSIFAILFCFPLLTFSQNVADIWSEKEEGNIVPMGTRVINPLVYRTIEADTSTLKNAIFSAPHESVTSAENSQTILTVPLPDGEFQDYQIVMYDMMEDGLSERFPEIKTGYGISTGKDKSIIRFDWTYRGFHAMITGVEKTIFIDPYSFDDKNHYVAYYTSDYPAPAEEFICHVEDQAVQVDNTTAVEKSGDCVFRSYRLAMATTGQYSNYHGASNSGQANLVLSAVTTTMNRVNQVYERDVSIRMILIANTDDVFYYSGASDPYTNNDGGAMLGQNQSNLDAVIGSSNYDIGHVFSTGGGGIASLYSPCSSSSKARGVTGGSNPVGDPFDIDYVAHEMGHQFGAHHTQNNDCNRTNSTAMEPGSASTIMGYAGICSPNIQGNSDDYFHGISVQEMNNFITTGNGNTCDTPIASSNNPPTVSGGSNHTIPRLTPFVLTATGSDPEGDPIYYCWEQWDNEVGSMPPASGNSQGPMFRSFDPTLSPDRYFPRLADLVNNVSPTWEVLPGVSRNMEFRVTARDLNGTQGCTDEDNVLVTVSSSAGPFMVTYPNTAVFLTEGQNTTVTWDVAGTNTGAVSCANVDIFLSYDGGFTYPVTLASGVSNNGSAIVTIPPGTSFSARIMVKCSDNIFFDISNADFTIEPPSIPDYIFSVSPDSRSVCATDNPVFNIDVASLLGYNNPVSLSLSGLPFGANHFFSPNPVTPGNSATLTLSNLNLIPVGNYTLTVTANSASGMKSQTIELTILPLPATITLMQPANNATDVSLTPSLLWLSDANATYYEVQIATDPGFTNIVLSTTSPGNNFTPNTDLASNTTYYWKIRGMNDVCSGTWSLTRNFTTLPCLAITNTQAQTIPHIGTINSIINFPAVGTISDVNVGNIQGTHSYVGDLTFTLRSPSNTEVVLMSGECGSQNDFNLGFDDESSNVFIPCPPTSGLVYQSQGNLSDFDGEELNGDWRLIVTDNSSGDQGNLVEWELQLCATNSTLLPVELTKFEVRAMDEMINLNWETAYEFNNAGFEIQRRAAFETEFSTIDWLESLGETDNQPNRYLYGDKDVLKGIVYYYRLKQIDHDGKFTFSPVRSAMLESDEVIFNIFPNPVTSILNINCVGGIPEKATYKISDPSGRILREDVIDDCFNTIDMQHLPSGIYFLQIDTPAKRWIEKLIK